MVATKERIKIVCPKCGNKSQFTEQVRGACYENRYYLNEDGSEVVDTQNQKFFDAEDVTFICPSCDYDLSEDDFEKDKNEDTDIRGQLMTKYREHLIATREESNCYVWAYQALKNKIIELKIEQEGWQRKYRQAEEGEFDILGRDHALEMISKSISRVSDLIFMLNEILKAKENS